ncbi:uncharacterized protein LOC118281207 [Spodoptera frugiperda]|uniref:Uncharacterized protein LOC118281207 n=1 Tax=Spodoptera frugiperda TaxID=7108 RepID=A0A9R0F0X0_SPOFR|nr:uncharacterized protein LOC118281207 [Spodoptera frugiperda]
MSVGSILIAILICFSPQVSMKIYDGLSFGAYCVRKPSKCPSGTSIVCNIGSKQYQEVCTSISPHDKAYSSKELKNLVVKINRKPITPDSNLSLLRSLDKTLKEATEVL